MNIYGLLVLNALAIWGIHCATGKGEIGEFAGFFVETYFPQWIAKPLVQCPPCMPSIWGSLAFWLFGPPGFWLGTFYVLSLSGLMRLVVAYSEPKQSVLNVTADTISCGNDATVLSVGADIPTVEIHGKS